MRARLLLAAILWLATVVPLFAGAWPREPGAAFISQRFDYDRSWRESEASASFYGEYGLTRRFTLVGQLSNEDQPWTVSRASLGLNYAIGRLDASNKLAVSLGVSTPPNLMGVMTETRIETGVHWGRGFESRWGGGWATASARVLFARDNDRPITDFSALVGLRPKDGWMAMLGASRYRDEEGTYLKVTPSVGYELRDRLWVVPGVSFELTDDRSTGVGVAFWFSF